MKNIALTLAAALAALTSTAAFIPQANQAWVTNKIDEVVGTNTAARIAAVAQAATNYTDSAIVAAGGVTPLVVTNIAGAVVSNVVPSWARSATPPITQETDPTVPQWAKSNNPPSSTNITDGINVINADGTANVEIHFNQWIPTHSDIPEDPYFEEIYYRNVRFDYEDIKCWICDVMIWNGNTWSFGGVSNMEGDAANENATELMFPNEEKTYRAKRYVTRVAFTNDIAPWARFGMSPPSTYTDAQAGAVATNVVRSINGGVWDAALQVWWTSVMSNGKLTYQATTNVNLNAGN